jgi:two-component system, cell cycle response regulator
VAPSERQPPPGRLRPDAETDTQIDQPTMVGAGPADFRPSKRAPTFTILEGPRVGQDIFPIPVTQRAVFIGRDRQTCDWCIDDPSISRQHCKVFVHDTRGGAALRLEDLDSTNGTFVNGRPIKEVDLQSGDKVHFADVLVRFDLMDQADLQYQRALIDRAQRGDRDPLTGLLTRSFLEHRMPQMIEGTEKLDIPLTLVMLDLDHFKLVNDTHGHPVGDVVLQRAAQALVAAIRRRDPAVRMGGEEYAAFLSHTPLVEGYHVAERIRRNIELLQFDDTASDLHVTASLGVAERRPDESAESWLHRADEALYAAKRQGRNRTFVDDRKGD